MDKQETLGMLNLHAEIDRLQKQIYFKDKQIREYEREIHDYTLREKQFLAEIERLENEQSNAETYKVKETQFLTKEEFLNPKLDGSTKLNRENEVGMEEKWDEIMLAYTDEIFVKHDKFDTLFYRDDSEKCYLTPTGNTRLLFPITQETLDEHNILKIRKPTAEELKLIIKEYNL